jgi:hypothetical protein
MQALALEKERTRCAEAVARAAEAESRAAAAEARAATAEHDLLLANQGSVARNYWANGALQPPTDRGGRKKSASPSSTPHSGSQSVVESDGELENEGANTHDEDEDAEEAHRQEPAGKGLLQVHNVSLLFSHLLTRYKEGNNVFVSPSMQCQGIQMAIRIRRHSC